MYLGDPQPRKKRRSSPVRVVILLLLIGFSLYVYGLIKEERIESPFVPTPTPTRSAMSYASEAEDLYRQGKLGQAIIVYEQAIALDPDNVLFYIPLARLLTLEGKTLEAIRRAQRAIDMAPESAPAWAALGTAYDWDGQVPESIEACNRAIELDPTYAEGYACLAEAYADAMRWAEATETAQTAIELDERSVIAHRNYGYVLEIQGNWTQAIAQYERALEIHPNLPYLHIALGQNYRALGNIDAALSQFERAAEIDPQNAQANFELGWTYLINLGEYQQAETYLQQAVETNPEFGRAFGSLAIAYWSRRNYEDAIPNFERAIQLDCAAARQNAEEFLVTLEDSGAEIEEPSSEIVLRGAFTPVRANSRDQLQAELIPERDEAQWQSTRGELRLDTETGEYTLTIRGIPWAEPGKVYVGWFEDVKTLDNQTLSTGPLSINSNGNIEIERETGWVAGPPIEYFYTLGLAYFYKDECDKSYPLFEAALRIDPEENNALEGLQYCQEAESE